MNDQALKNKLRGVVDDAVDRVAGIAHQHANEVAVTRMREARQRQRTEANHSGYGQNPAFPQEKEGLEYMIEKRKQGFGYRGIAEMMEKRGFSTRRGVYWNPGTVKKILARHKVK